MASDRMEEVTLWRWRGEGEPWQVITGGHFDHPYMAPRDALRDIRGPYHATIPGPGERVVCLTEDELRAVDFGLALADNALANDGFPNSEPAKSNRPIIEAASEKVRASLEGEKP